VLDSADGSFSLAVSLSMVEELLEGQVDTAAANGVHWGTRSPLVTALLHFLELEAELELLGARCNAPLTKDRVDAHWILACPTSDLLASYVLSSIIRSPPDGAGE
jgi:hypothetical protein